MPTNKPAPARPAESVPPVSGEAPAGHPGAVAKPPTVFTRITNAIAAIDSSPATPTQIRSLVGEFYKHVGQKRSSQNFPITLHQHPFHPENASNPFVSRAAGLCHHIGAAIKAFQEVQHLERTLTLNEPIAAAIITARDLLGVCLGRLEAIAAAYPRVRESGDVRTGYYLKVENE